MLLKRLFAGRCCADGLQNIFKPGTLPDNRFVPGKQNCKVFRARRGLLEQRLEQQMFEHVLASYVDNDRKGWASVNDVGKVLVWTDADVDARISSMWTQLIDDMLVGSLIRDKI